MKVGFDISQTAHGGGVGVYTNNLAWHLSQDPELEMVYFYSSFRKGYGGVLPNVKTFKIPPTAFETIFNRVRIVPIEKFTGPLDIFHSSDWVQPPSKAKKITTYHDLVPIKFPNWSHPKIVDVQKRRLKIVEKEIDMVIAVSNSTKKDLMEVSKIPAEKIKVIYEGVGPRFKKLDENEVQIFKRELNLPKKFVLAISGVGERKNISRIKEASKKYDLIILGEDIRLQEDKLPFLYNGAEVLLYPSFYEGFGLPVLEAMACGTPVITSSTSSLPEVGGDAPEYVNPESVIDIENKLRQVMEDGKKRESMAKKGLIQAKKFSWEKCAKETAEVYKNLME